EWELGPMESVDIRVVDETGKFSFIDPDLGILQAFFDREEFRPNQSAELIDNLLLWTREGEGQGLGAVSPTYYQSLNPPVEIPRRPLLSWDELNLIYGWGEICYDENGRETDFFQRLKNTFSIYHQDQVNLNTATP